MSASGDPSAECRSCMRYFFSARQAATNDNTIRICRSSKFALDLNTRSRNLSEVNKIDALTGYCTCAAWEKIVHAASAHSGTALAALRHWIGSTAPSDWRHCAIGLTALRHRIGGTAPSDWRHCAIGLAALRHWIGGTAPLDWRHRQRCCSTAAFLWRLPLTAAAPPCNKIK